MVSMLCYVIIMCFACQGSSLRLDERIKLNKTTIANDNREHTPSNWDVVEKAKIALEAGTKTCEGEANWNADCTYKTQAEMKGDYCGSKTKGSIWDSTGQDCSLNGINSGGEGSRWDLLCKEPLHPTQKWSYAEWKPTTWSAQYGWSSGTTTCMCTPCEKILAEPYGNWTPKPDWVFGTLYQQANWGRAVSILTRSNGEKIKMSGRDFGACGVTSEECNGKYCQSGRGKWSMPHFPTGCLCLACDYIKSSYGEWPQVQNLPVMDTSDDNKQVLATSDDNKYSWWNDGKNGLAGFYEQCGVRASWDSKGHKCFVGGDLRCESERKCLCDTCSNIARLGNWSPPIVGRPTKVIPGPTKPPWAIYTPYGQEISRMEPYPMSPYPKTKPPPNTDWELTNNPPSYPTELPPDVGYCKFALKSHFGFGMVPVKKWETDMVWKGLKILTFATPYPAGCWLYYKVLPKYFPKLYAHLTSNRPPPALSTKTPFPTK